MILKGFKKFYVQKDIRLFLFVFQNIATTHLLAVYNKNVNAIIIIKGVLLKKLNILSTNCNKK